jgi:hypothetical protein
VVLRAEEGGQQQRVGVAQAERVQERKQELMGQHREQMKAQAMLEPVREWARGVQQMGRQR